MALKRIDPNEVLKVVSIKDDAIDLEKSDIKAYESDRDYKKHLVFKEGMQPTLLLVKNIGTKKNKELTSGHFEWIPQGTNEDGTPKPAKVDMKDQEGLVIKYFESAVSEVEDFDNGNWVKKKTNPDEWPPFVVAEIGSFVMIRTSLGDDQKKS